ncbi:polysaccharide deacetylase family protein [Streptomyces sp. NPDC096191]|uniref:polysaccharide deacetylase family protein n=1 Tax=Streptomyces sp. NPDC096191 TaxID=3155426 RepID=UPI003328E0FE
MRRGRFRPAVAALAAVLLTGCAQFAGPAGHPAAGEPARGGDRSGDQNRNLPPVVDHVRTTDRVVFLTYDDGAERDPRFTALLRERRLPVTLFLTDTVAGPAYGHFAGLRSVGASLQNHTLDHRSLRGLPYAGQRAEICGQQTKLRSRFGVRPHLFRPPYGQYDTTTLRAAADCGITAVVLWRAALNTGGELTYTRGEHRLHPGDIVSVDLTAHTERVLKTIEEQGLRVARLDDYLTVSPSGV